MDEKQLLGTYFGDFRTQAEDTDWVNSDLSLKRSLEHAYTHDIDFCQVGRASWLEGGGWRGALW